MLDTKRHRRMPAEETLELWRRYRATGDRRHRDRLVLTFAPLVKYIVYKKVREIPARCDVEDFISCGLEALIHSIERFDPSRGASLEQFAWTRIHGAVLDELRRQDWAPRSLRRWERDINRARETFSTLHGRRPTRSELAEALGTSEPELRRHEDEIACSDLTSLNALVGGEDDTTIERIDTLVSQDARLDPEAAASRDDAKLRFRAAFARLPRREREVAVLLYVKHLTLREIGDVLGVSESRICQIHGQLKRTLRRDLAADTSLFSEVA
ncbi:MAG: polymerase sigma factor FliA [Solirubrobacteraceae bacterium]|jgi:RNA polymerase sigma factor for flagellar operon FliA|nr:polymerase sigma factor FliA [Solirubrobacteraceae bacterium]